ncbi:MAG: hypothetical protein HETSPECPRED_009811 [Heterodermia speciosa]|uniref:Anaphase-promoting complex subunit 4 WD40 domain-containing protein n=1 Tax=Heterodermia speciosa TaxID=116794 RepID=A0A8H3G3G3_9LECA|nr:MAG: hypothetical protein HETSPECPRED_009811 [Heterodermia speciosa]
MAPILPRKPVAKDRFPALFATLKTQTYYDSTSRGSHAIRTIAWSPTGHLIATGSTDRTLRIWNPDKPTSKNSTELRGHNGAIERVCWNPTKEAELASDDTLIPISISFPDSTPTALPSLPQTVQTNQLAFPHSPPSSQPTTLLLTTGNGTVDIADWPPAPTSTSNGAGKLNIIHSMHAHTSAALSLELSPTGRYLAIGGSDALISLWDTTEWVCRRTLTGMGGGVRSVSFSWDGSFVVGGSDEGLGIEIAHVETGEYIHTVPTTTPAPCVAWHPQRYWLAYSGDAQGLKIVGAAGGNL